MSFKKVWRGGDSSVYHFSLLWVRSFTEQRVSNARAGDPRHPSWAGCCADTPIRQCRQIFHTHACLPVTKMIDAKVSTGWSLSSLASSTTEQRKQDPRISSQMQTDFTSNEIRTEVIRIFEIVLHEFHSKKIVIDNCMSGCFPQFL